MSLVLRKSYNTEEYFKYKPTDTYKQLSKKGLIKEFEGFDYIDHHEDLPSMFNYKKHSYKIEYFDGCFYPYLLRLVKFNDKLINLENTELWKSKKK